MAPMTGGCACGAIRYECNPENPVIADHCYCRDCQHSSGAAMASLLWIAKDALKLIRGEARYFTTVGDTGKKISRGFCATCGSPLFVTVELGPEAIAISAGSLDDPNQYRPSVSVYMDRVTAWAPVDNSLPKFPRMAPAAARCTATMWTASATPSCSPA